MSEWWRRWDAGPRVRADSIPIGKRFLSITGLEYRVASVDRRYVRVEEGPNTAGPNTAFDRSAEVLPIR